jgi:hypothetical protein
MVVYINCCENILGDVRGKPQDVEKFLDPIAKSVRPVANRAVDKDVFTK